MGAFHALQASGCYGCSVGPTSWSWNQLRACGGDCLTPAYGLCMLQDPVSCLQPQWGLFRLFSRSSQPHLPDRLLHPGYWQQRHESGSWQAAVVGYKDHEAAGTDLPAGLSGLGTLPGGHLVWRAPCVEGMLPTCPVFWMSLLPSPLFPNTHGPFSTLSPFSLHRDCVLNFGLLSPYSLTGALAHV